MPLYFPPASHPFLTLPDGWDTVWKAAKAVSGSTAAWMTVLGESYAAGSVSDDFIAHSWLGVLKATLVARGLTAAGDFWMPTASVAFTSGFAGTPPFVVNATGLAWLGWGYGRIPFYGTQANGSITFSSPYACTDLDIISFNQNAGTFNYTLDGGAPVQITATGAKTFLRTQLSSLANTTHTVLFDTQSGGNVMAIQGVATYPTAAGRTSGIGYGRIAYGGAALADYGVTATQPSDLCQVWQGKSASTTGFGFPTQPSLAIIALGINDGASLWGVQGYRHTFERLIHAFRRGVANCSILIMANCNPDGVSSDVTSGLFGSVSSYGLYLAEMALVAQKYGCAFANVHAKWGDTGVAQGFQAANQPHPTTAGHADIASLLAGVL